MDFLKLCCVSPHPPIVVPEIGGKEVEKIRDTADALDELSRDIAELAPDTLIVMSPHTPIFRNAFSVMMGTSLEGSFYQFGAPDVSIEAEPDRLLSEALLESAARRGVPLVENAGRELDHGVLVPLYYLAPSSYKLTCLSISLLDYDDHYQLGLAIRDAVESARRKTVFVASGDLSHRLTPGAPAGYSPKGQILDRSLVEIIGSADFGKLFELDRGLIEDAGECGLRSIITMAGILDGYEVQSRVLSYEGPFGVGYMVASAIPGEPNPKRELATQ